MNELEKDIEILLTKELTQKKGGSIGSVIGRLVGKISPLVIKHAPNILGTLGLAGISGAISGSTHRATAGRGIGQYVEYGLMLTPNQKKKLGSAHDGITLRLTKNQLSGNDMLLLTNRQVTKIKKSKQKGVGMDLKLSSTQLKKQGGFLGALAAGLLAPALGKMIGLGNTGEGLQLPGTRRGRGVKKDQKGKGLRLPGT